MEKGDCLDQIKSAQLDSAGLINEERHFTNLETSKAVVTEMLEAGDSTGFITSERLQKDNKPEAEHLDDRLTPVTSESSVSVDSSKITVGGVNGATEDLVRSSDVKLNSSDSSQSNAFILRESGSTKNFPQHEISPPVKHISKEISGENNDSQEVAASQHTISGNVSTEINTELIDKETQGHKSSENTEVISSISNLSDDGKTQLEFVKKERSDTLPEVIQNQVAEKNDEFIHQEGNLQNRNKPQLEDAVVTSNQGTPGQKASDDKEQSLKDEDEEWLDILGSGQLKKKIVKKAENSFRPQNSYICTINVEGRLSDGTVVEKYENLKIQVGDVEVVQGIDLALPLMDVGEVALLEIGPRFAYGNLGKFPEIPPDTRLMYTVELLSAENEPDLESLSIADRKIIGNNKRERGNWWFSRQEYSFAIQSYRRAIEYLDDIEGGFTTDKKESEDTEKQLQDLLEDRLKVFNNLAAAQMKIKAYDTALTSVENVLRCQPQNVKALFRKGKILAAKGETEAAVAVLRTALQLEPDSKVIKQEMQRLLETIKETTKQEKNLYKKMLGQEKISEKSSKTSKVHYISWGIVCSSIAAILLGAVAYRYKFP